MNSIPQSPGSCPPCSASTSDPSPALKDIRSRLERIRRETGALIRENGRGYPYIYPTDAITSIQVELIQARRPDHFAARFHSVSWSSRMDTPEELEEAGRTLARTARLLRELQADLPLLTWRDCMELGRWLREEASHEPKHTTDVPGPSPEGRGAINTEDNGGTTCSKVQPENPSPAS